MANNISTLKSDIAEMEEVFNDASTPSDIKKALEPALKKAKEDLAELEKKETVEKPAVTKKEVTTKKSPSDALKKCQDLLAKYQNKKENDAERVKKRASQGKPPTLTPAETVKSTAKKVEAKVVDMMERTGEGLQSSEINQLASGIIATIKSTLEGIEDTTKKQRFLKEIGKEIHDLEKRLPKAAAMGMYMADGGSIDDKYMIYGTSDEGWFAVDKKTKQQISPSIFGKGHWDSKEEVLADLNSKKFEDGGSIADSNTEMLMSNVHSIKHHAEEIENILANNVPVEAWVSAKAERASTDLSDITHYLDGLVGKMAIGGMLEHDLHRGDEVKEIYKDYGILEDADMNIFVYDPNVGERIDVSSVNEAKRMIDSMDSDLRKRAGLMADGGEIHKIADTMTDSEFESQLSKLNQKQKDKYNRLVRLGDSPKLAIATVLLQKESKWDDVTIRAYTMADGGGIKGVYEGSVRRINGKDYLINESVLDKNGDIVGWNAYEVVYENKMGEKHINYERTKKNYNQKYFENNVALLGDDVGYEYFSNGGQTKIKKVRTLEEAKKDPRVEDIYFEEEWQKSGSWWLELKEGYICRSMGSGTIHEDTLKEVLDLLNTDVVKESEYADGGHTQSYDDREDERLSMEYGKISGKDFVGSHKQTEHSRRDDARFEERMAKGGKLIGKQKNIDVNKNGKLDSQDFKLLRERAKARLKK